MPSAPRIARPRLWDFTCADIMPVYHLGDSQLLDFWGFKWLSRKLRASLGVVWGRWGLPLPRQHDLIALVDYPIPGAHPSEWNCLVCQDVRA